MIGHEVLLQVTAINTSTPAIQLNEVIPVVIMNYLDYYVSHQEATSQRPAGRYINTFRILVRPSKPVAKDVTVSHSFQHLPANSQENLIVPFCALRYLQGAPLEAPQHKFLGPLPDTKFWEMDLVTVNKDPTARVYAIASIRYEIANAKESAGGIYSITEWNGFDQWANGNTPWHSFYTDSDLQLHERGLIWQHYHHFPTTFRNATQKAKFSFIIGQGDTIRNPATETYVWHLKEAIAAVRNGAGDVLVINNKINFGIDPCDQGVCVYRFHNRVLGEIISQEFLENVDRTAQQQ